MTRVFAAMLLALALAASHDQSPPTYEIYAVRFGVIPQFAVSGLVAGADSTRKLDIPVMVWLLKGSDGRRVLFDSGFYRKKFVDGWKVQNFRSPADAVAAAGVPADQINDVVISHAHWDHVDGADLFPKATVWIQREEYRYYTGEAWQSPNTHGGIDQEDMQSLLAINMAGRLRLIDGDDQQPIPGIRCYTGGKHTWASEYISVPVSGGTAVLTSDNVYLYENLEKHVAIAQTLDPASNLKAQDRIRMLATSPDLIVPGHDPAVFDRYARVADGIVRIH